MSWKSGRRGSLRLRLALIFVGGSLATLLVALAFLQYGFRFQLHLKNERLLAARLKDVANILARHPDDPEALREEVMEETSAAFATPIMVRVTEPDGYVIQPWAMRALLPPQRFQEGPQIEVGGRRFLVAGITVGNHLIQGAMDVSEDERVIREFQQSLFSTLLVVAAGCSVLGFLAAHQGLKPLRQIALSAQGITAQRLRQRLDPELMPSELGELVQALNGMLDRLDHAFDRLQRFSADLAHELRTPLNILMGEAEVALAKERPAEEYRQVLESSLDEIRRLTRLISRMLFLARVEDPAGVIERAPVDSALLVRQLLDFFEAVAEEGGVALTGEGSGTFSGDAEMLRQALANLVANALAATPAGGAVRLRAGPGEGGAVLEVADTGRGVAAGDLPHLFDRFYRATVEPSPSGTGLGLAIVKSIAQLHGGRVEVSSQPGVGTTVRILLPGV